jgi:hypothetical protein
MKKLLLMMALFAISFANAQSFDGVQITGNISSLIDKFKAKGYTSSAKYETSYRLNGKVFGEKVELWLFYTPITKQACKAVIYFPKRYSWQSIKSDYYDYRSILIQKYGEPESSYDFFSSPYYEGDGFEITAIQSDKCTYASFWENPLNSPNTYISVRITEFQQVAVTYENKKNMDLLEKEKDKANKSVFR